MSNGYLRGGRPDVNWWRTQINAGIAFRKKFASQQDWDRWRKMYRGQWDPGVLPSNLFFKMARTIVPRVYFRNPSVSVTPRKPGMLQWAFAQLVERVDNKMIRQMRLKQSMKEITQDAFFFGTGIGKLGFGSTVPTNNDLFATVGPGTDKSGRLVEYKSTVHENMPWFGRTPTGSFIVPAGNVRLSDARWAAEWFRLPVDDVKSDTRFKHTADLGGSNKIVRHGQGADSTFKYRQPLEMVDLVEIRDKKTGQVFVLAPYHSDKVLLDPQDDALQYDNRLPYYDLIFNDDDEVFWGIPDSRILEPQQREINEIRTQEMKHRRLSLIRILCKRNGIKPEEAAKMVDEIVSPVVWTEEMPEAVLKIIEGGDIPEGLMKMDAIVNQDVRENMGFSRNEFGEISPANSRTSATESRIVKAASEIRVDERRDSAADMLVEIIQDMNRIIFENWTEEIVLDVAGPMGVPMWVKFRPQMLKTGAYEIKIDPDTSLPESKETRQNRALVVYETLKTNPMIDPIQLTRYLLHEMHGVQFDEMMRGMPPGLGGPSNPLELEQFVQVMSLVAQQAPQALTAGGQNVAPVQPVTVQ